MFDARPDQIPPEAATILDNALWAYANCGARDVLLAGHTDTAGEAPDNLVRSAQQNALVEAYLVARGVPAERISSQAFGESQPRVPTADNVREPQNRRVEITYGMAPITLARKDLRNAQRDAGDWLRQESDLLARVRRDFTEERFAPLVDEVLSDPAGDRLRTELEAILERPAAGLSEAELRSATEDIARLRAELAPHYDRRKVRVAALEEWRRSHAQLKRAIEGLTPLLAQDENLKQPVLDEVARGAVRAALDQAGTVLRREGGRSFTSFETLDPSRASLETQTRRIAALDDRYRDAGLARAKQLRRDVRLIDQALSSAPELYLEITSPYMRAENAGKAYCAGSRLRFGLIEDVARLQPETYDPYLFEDPEEEPFECDEEETPDEALERERRNLDYVRDDDLRAIMTQLLDADDPAALANRIRVNPQQRRFEAPLRGSVPLGAHREVRMRVQGAEKLVLDAASPDLTREARSTLANLKGWIERYNARALSLPRIACAAGEGSAAPFEEEWETACEETPAPALTLVIEAALDPAKSPEAASFNAGARLSVILEYLQPQASDAVVVRAVKCMRPWHEGRDGAEIVNLSLIPEGVEAALDVCTAIQTRDYGPEGPDDPE